MTTSKYDNNLDNVRYARGNNGLIDYFNKLITDDIEKAISLINDRETKFSSLFLLKDEINHVDILDRLSEKNRVAIEIINEVLENKNRNITYDISTLNYVQSIRDSLKWIVETGWIDNIVDDTHCEVTDIAAIFLVDVYKDKDILPVIVDLIFRRKKKGMYTHELIWAFFKCNDVKSIAYIVEKLKTKDLQDIKEACKLLSFIPGLNERLDSNKYDYATKWLSENKKFMYFTGQSHHEKMMPKLCDVNLSAKYLLKKIDVTNGKINEKLTKKEEDSLKEFNKLSKESQLILANYSNWLYNKSLNWWNIWVNKPIDEQLRISAIGGNK